MRRPARARAGAALLLLLFLGACRHGDSGSKSGTAASHSGVVGTAEAFIAAVNASDADAASDLVAWDLWVAEDPRLAHLTDEMRKTYGRRALTDEDLRTTPITGSTVTLGEILDPGRSEAAMIRAARERFVAAFQEDFAPDPSRPKARLLTWHADQRERSATILMPDGEVLETRVVYQKGAYRLLPRF